MINSKLLITVAMLFCGCCLLAGKLTVVQNGREFTVKTATLEAGFKDGMIVALKDLKNGKIWAKRQINDIHIPVGLGVLYDLKTFRRGHIPWGEPMLNQHLKPSFKLNNYFRPTTQSEFQLIRYENKVKATWTGLDNGKKFLPQARFSMTIGADASGALTLQTTGRNPQGKLFGLLAPITNLDNDATYIHPSFGGIAHTKDGVPALMPLYRAPFVEAPIMIAQNNRKSIAFWMENPRQQPFYQFINRSGKSFAMIFENQSLMPFEPWKNHTSPVLKINVFDGDWKAAATPYRNWYRNYYKKEIAIRDSVAWAKKIYTIIDIYMHAPKDEVLTKITKIYPRGSVLFQIRNARACSFDRDLPDWTPRKNYISDVKRIHNHGMKTIAYVNTYCANYKSRVWNRDKLSSFFLTRKNSPGHYKHKGISDTENALNEKLIGTIDYTDSKNQFAKIKPGRILYGDPLSTRWRKYHADMMKWWNTTTKTDANYEDTAGCVGDYGNGVINGLSAGEGSVAQMRLLQKTQKNIPMASEFGPDGIAFACNWVLNFAGQWGYDDFKRYRTNNQYPLTVYLYGYRQWIPAIRGTTDLRRHAMAASSDATGGMGFILVDRFNKSIEDLDKDYSFIGHFLQRSKLFSKKSLTPFFPEGNYPDNIRCMYKGSDGIYSYYDDGKLQLMLSPDKKELYGRVFKANEVKTTLWLPNWPLQDGKRIFGLNPANHYPLFVKPENCPELAITVERLPANIVLAKYYDSPNFTYMEFDGKADTLSIKLKLLQRFKEFYVNDEKTDIENIKGRLPLRLLAVKKEATNKFTKKPLVRTISSGRLIGKVSSLVRKPKHIVRGQKLYWLKAKSAYVDYLVKVPAKDSSIEVYFRNLAPDSRHGCDASIIRFLINGKEIKSYDARSKNPTGKPKYLFDTKLHAWKVPVGKYAGKTILVTLISDWKQSPNWDRQYIGIPCLVKDTEQKFIFKTYSTKHKTTATIRNLKR